MKRKYLRSPVTGKVLNRKGHTYMLRIRPKELRRLADLAEHSVAVEWAIEEAPGVFSSVTFVLYG